MRKRLEQLLIQTIKKREGGGGGCEGIGQKLVIIKLGTAIVELPQGKVAVLVPVHRASVAGEI